MGAKLRDLIGKTMARVENNHNEEIIFTTDEGKKYKLYHEPEGCENVSVEEIIGGLSDLVGSPMIEAEEVKNPKGITKEEQNRSFTWTFYKFATVKGFVTIRWYGDSGYYSEGVSFCEC